MPALPHQILEMSRVRRLSSKTSVLVSEVSSDHCVMPGPAEAAAKLADEMPVPFGKVTPVKLFQVSGIGRNVNGSDMTNSRRGAHLNSRSPVKRVVPAALRTVSNWLWFHSF